MKKIRRKFRWINCIYMKRTVSDNRIEKTTVNEAYNGTICNIQSVGINQLVGKEKSVAKCKSKSVGKGKQEKQEKTCKSVGKGKQEKPCKSGKEKLEKTCKSVGKEKQEKQEKTCKSVGNYPFKKKTSNEYTSIKDKDITNSNESIVKDTPNQHFIKTNIDDYEYVLV